jgi:hypothetical protein
MNNYKRVSNIIETIRIRKGAENSSDVHAYLVGMMTAVLTDAQLSAIEEVAEEFM